jgi:acylphosphatase
MASSYRFVVIGRVQGVGFRYSAQRKAQQLQVTGWVANRPDGAVEGLACGDEAALGRFNTWLSDGPPGAQVHALDWNPSGEVVTDGFHIRRL